MFSLSLSATMLAAIFGAGTPGGAKPEFLAPDVAFKVTARMQDPHTIALSYDIADGYYMYRERFKFTATGATLGEPALPPGKIKFDDTFQKDVESYRKRLTITVPVKAKGMFTLHVSSQGCADAGLCYAPQQVALRLQP